MEGLSSRVSEPPADWPRQFAEDRCSTRRLFWPTFLTFTEAQELVSRVLHVTESLPHWLIEPQAEVAELADALDSGSSPGYPGGGSSPLFGTLSNMDLRHITHSWP